MPVTFPVSSPSAQGVDARGILAFLDAVAAEPTSELHSIAVVRRGYLVAEGYWAPYQADDLPLVYSVSKTFTATAVGLAVAEGLFGLDDRLVDLIPEDVPADVDRRVREITVHHLLSMSTGRDVDALPLMLESPATEWARTYLSQVPAEPVGSRHIYDNGASWMCGELVRRSSGQSLVEFLRPRLLEPLGLTEFTWDTDSLGRELGWSGAHVPTRGLAAMGELYRCDGVWQGRRLLPEGWVARLGVQHIPTAHEVNPEWCLGYGYQVWMGREGYRLDGAYGQFSFVLADRESVVAITSAQSFTQRLIDLLWEHLVPALGSGGDEAADAALAERLLALRIPAPEDSGLGYWWEADGPLVIDPSIAPHVEEQLNLPAVYGVVIFRHPEGGFRVSLGYSDTRPTVDIDGSGWERSLMELLGHDVPVAVAAGADADGQVEARILFLDTPHTLVLKLDHRGWGRIAWSVPPLQSNRLEALRAR